MSEKKMKKTVILIPALDPPDLFADYVQELMQAGFHDILVVDDGSSSDSVFQRIRQMGAVVLKHEKNEGKGQALKTGLTWYQEHYDYNTYAGVITADSDGQHLCKDVKQLAEYLEAGSQELILGSRDFSLPNVPPKSRFGNNLTAWIFRYLLHIKIRDTQTGLRGIPNSLVDPCLKVHGKRFEYETSMLTEVGKKAGICELPIETVYYEENKGTHFNPVVDSIKIYKTIFGTFLRYLFSSLSSCIVDLVLFTLLSKLIFPQFAYRILAATCLARIVSAIYNFCMNRNLVFRSQAKYGTSAMKYASLCVLQALASAGLVTLFYMITRLDEVLIKLVVDTLLFFVSYHIQKTFIFQGGCKNEK